MLKNTLIESENIIVSLISSKLGSSERLQIPKIAEAYSFFHNYLISNPELTHHELPSMPQNLKNIKEGIYKKENKLICVSDIPKGMFKYLTLFMSEAMAISKMSPDLSGKLLCILVEATDNFHYEPEAFSYLILDEFFEMESPEHIIPFQILPNLIPPQLEYQWVYIAMRKFAKEYLPSYDYKRLASEVEEIELLKKFDLLD